MYSTCSPVPCSKGGKLQRRGKINLIGRLQLTTEKTKEEDNESIIALRVLRTQVQSHDRCRPNLMDSETSCLVVPLNC